MRWEYTFVVWFAKTGRKLEHGSWKQIHKSFLEIIAPDGETETRLVHDSEDSEAQTTKLGQVLNELGAEGWELIGEVVTDSVIGPKNGWDQVGVPIRAKYALKRPSEGPSLRAEP